MLTMNVDSASFLKKKVAITKRVSEPFMEGNLWLITDHIFQYLSFKDQLNVMSLNYSTYKLFRKNNKFWYRLWYDKMFSEPEGYNFIHSGPYTYKCLNPNLSTFYWRNKCQSLLEKRHNPKLCNNVIDKKDLMKIVETIQYRMPYRFASNRSTLLDRGYIKSSDDAAWKPFIQRIFSCAHFPANIQTNFDSNNSNSDSDSDSDNYLNQIAYNRRHKKNKKSKNTDDHWTIKNIYPLSYYDSNYNPEIDYYTEFIRTETVGSIKNNIKLKQAGIARYTKRRDSYLNAIKVLQKKIDDLSSQLVGHELALEVRSNYLPKKRDKNT